MENCLKLSEQYLACTQAASQSGRKQDVYVGLLSSAEKASTTKTARRRRKSAEDWLQSSVEQQCGTQRTSLEDCLYEHHEPLRAAVRAQSVCQRCPCKYVTIQEENHACSDEESRQCCHALVHHRWTFLACWKQLADMTANKQAEEPT